MTTQMFPRNKLYNKFHPFDGNQGILFSENCQMSKMDLIAKNANDFQTLTIFAKSSIFAKSYI